MASKDRGIAVVTGGNSGIGRGIAEELSGMGYDVMLVARNENRLKSASAELHKRFGNVVEYAVCDLSRDRAVDALCRRLASMGSTIGVLVNNAGIYLPGSTGKSTMGMFDRSFSVNMRGMFHLTNKLLPLMRNGAGRIILISSIWALDSYPTDGNDEGTLYSISKWGMRGWARSLRAELKKRGVGVSIIYPGEVLTPMWRGSGIPESRFIKPSDIGKIVGAIVSTNPEAVIEEVSVRPMDWRY